MPKTVDHASRAHALLSPSSSDRWLNCTPSVRLEERSGLPDTSGDAAKEGTLAHEFSETMLRLELGQIAPAVAEAVYKRLRKSQYYSDEMLGHAATYVNAILSRIDEDPDAEVIVEAPVDYTEYVKEGTGSTDSTTLSKRVLYVDDFKYGKSQVDAEENTQLMLYGLGVYLARPDKEQIRRIVLTIHQPRLNHVSSWDMSVRSLMRWAEKELRPKAALAWKGEGELVAGTWCKWCKVSAKCKAQARQSLDLARHEFKDPSLLTDAELIRIYSLIRPLESWIKDVKTYVLSAALAGKNWDGYKLVNGKSNRVLTQPEEIIKTLRREGFAKEEFVAESLIPLTKIETLLGKAKFEKLLGKFVIKPDGAPTLTDVNDKRAGLGIESAIRDFKDL